MGCLVSDESNCSHRISYYGISKTIKHENRGADMTMGNEHKHIADNSETSENVIEETNECTKEETLAFFEELCEELDGVVPEEVMDTIKQVRPIEAGILSLWKLGGAIRTNNPKINLKGDYDLTSEVKELDDTIDGFTFRIARSPFMALAAAMAGDINANEEVIISRDLDGLVPIIIKEEGSVKRVGIVDYDERQLQLTLNLGFNIDIKATGTESEQADAKKEGLRKLEEALKDLKLRLDEPIKTFESPGEEKAVKAWCEKHSYTFAFVGRSSVDIHH